MRRSSRRVPQCQGSALSPGPFSARSACRRQIALAGRRGALAVEIQALFLSTTLCGTSTSRALSSRWKVSRKTLRTSSASTTRFSQA